MPKRRNEQECLVRQEPFAYAASTFVAGGPTYEAWAEVGASFADAQWIVCKHTYDGNNQNVRTQWAKDTNNKTGDFTNIIGSDNITPSLISNLTYV